jgi:hypothetical protein
VRKVQREAVDLAVQQGPLDQINRVLIGWHASKKPTFHSISLTLIKAIRYAHISVIH